MIPQHQTLFGPPHGDCFRACLASILEEDILDVPNYIAEPNYMKLWNAWLADEFGLRLLDWDFDEVPRFMLRGYWIAAVPSLNLDPPARHAIVMEGIRVAFDPQHPSNRRYASVRREDVRMATAFQALDPARKVFRPSPLTVPSWSATIPEIPTKEPKMKSEIVPTVQDTTVEVRVGIEENEAIVLVSDYDQGEFSLNLNAHQALALGTRLRGVGYELNGNSYCVGRAVS